MKKSQRARLAALTALSTRSEAEAAEFASLTALAAQHPDASKDSEDSAGLLVVDSPSAALAHSVVRLSGPIIGDTAQVGSAVGSAAAASPAPQATPAPSFASAIQAALLSLRSKNSVAVDLVAARASVAALTTDRDESRARVAALTVERDTAQAALATAHAVAETFAAYFGLDAKSLAGKSAAEVSALLNARISAQVAEQISTLGFEAGKLPAATSAETPASKNLHGLARVVAVFKTQPIGAN